MSSTSAMSRRRRRAALAAVLALVGIPLVTSGPAEAVDCPANTPCVKVVIVSMKDGEPTETTQQFTPAQINEMADVHDRVYYRLKHKNGKVSKTLRPANALSLHKLLANIQPAPAAATFSETPDLSGIPSVLGKDDLGDPQGDNYPFLDELPPAIYSFGSQIGYVRPQRTEDDVNYSDQFRTAPNSTLTLTFHTTGKLLEPVVGVGSTTVDTKAKNKFTITYAHSAGTRIREWDWTFGDGKTKTVKAPTHRYAKKGSYPVFVQVRGDDGSYGRSNVVQMKVNKPPKPPPSNGGSGGGGGSGSGGYGGGGGGYIPPYVPSTPPVDHPPADAPAPQETPTAPVDDGLEQVEGFVLVGAGADEGGSIPGTQDTSQATQADELSTSRKISGAVIGGLAIILLLGLGAEIETRWVSSRLAHLRGRE